MKLVGKRILKKSIENKQNKFRTEKTSAYVIVPMDINILSRIDLSFLLPLVACGLVRKY